MAGADQLDVYSDLDRRLVAATRGIRLLQLVSWPATLCEPQLAPETCSVLRSDAGTAPSQWTEHSS